MTVNELQIEENLAIRSGRSQRVLQSTKPRTTEKARGAITQGIARTGPGQIGKQLVGAVVADTKAIDIENGVGKSGPHQAISDVMHVWKAIHMPLVID